MELSKDGRKIMKKDITYIKKYWQYLRKHRVLLTIAFTLIPLISGFNILQPFLIQKAIDDAILQNNLNLLTIITICYGLCILCDFFCKIIQIFLFQYIGQKTILHIRKDLFKHLLKLSTHYYDKTPIGVITSRLTSDMESLNESFASGLVTLLADLLTLLAIITMMLFLSPKLTLITLLVVPPMIVIVNFFRIKLRKYFNQIRTTIGALNATIQEQLQGISIIQLFQYETKSFNQFHHLNKRYKTSTLNSVSYDAVLYSLIESINSIMIALMIWFGWGQYNQEFITIGLLVAFIEYIQKFFLPLKEISNKFAILQHALAALEKIFSTFEVKEFIESGTEKNINLKGNIAFNNVSFAYKNHEDKPILQDISFALKQKQWIAIVGPTGSGKTTIFRLLSKLYDGYTGSIKIDDIELNQFDINHLRHQISVVNQSNTLFSNTIAFNITLGNSAISYEKMIWAARCVNIHDFIMSLPENYNFKLMKGNQSLSSGQAQLISFARALANPSPIILLDEATANVDSLTEKKIQTALHSVLKEKTAIVIAHRLSTIKDAHMILALNNGKIIEYGNHNDLMKQKGFYYNLFQIQFSGL